MTNISVIIPWKGRPELKCTLAANADLFVKHSAELIVVNCGGDPQELASLIEGHNILNLGWVSISGCPFNRSMARNIGAHFSSSSSLFFLDSDIVFKRDVFSEAQPLLDACNCFIKVRRVYETEPAADSKLPFKEKIETHELTLEDGRRAVLQFIMGSDGSRCGSGLLLVRKEHFLAVNGFNSDLDGWGFEDLDFQLRLQFIKNITPQLVGEATHLTHSDNIRDIKGASRVEDFQKNMQRCFQNYGCGHFAGTYGNDLERWLGKSRRKGSFLPGFHLCQR